MMQTEPTTNGVAGASPNEILALIETARANALTARRIADEIENIEEIMMSDLLAIARACSSSISALDTLKTKIAGEEEPEPPQPAVTATHSHLSLIDAIAA